MNSSVSHVPPGFRFHPTEEELVNYYLRKKVASRSIDLDVIRDVDLYNIEPWDLQELCKIGNEEQHEWYFFSHKDKKYPTGTRTNRATKAGFWKATGRDKSIYSKHSLIGMRKTLVFYKGRAPNGLKSDWIMHEYRLETNENATPQEEGWVACRVFKKRMATMWKAGGNESTCWYDDDDQASLFMKDLRFPNPITQPHGHHHFYNHSCKQELDHLLHHNVPHDTILHLPHLESPKLLPQSVANSVALYTTTFDRNDGSTLQSSMPTQDQEQVHVQPTNINQEVADQQAAVVDQMTDWRVLDKFVASQLSHEGAVSKLTPLPNIASFHAADDEHMNTLYSDSNRKGTASGYTSFSIPSCQIDLWK